METATASVTRWVRGRSFRRVRPPRWPFVWRGLLPLLGILGLLLFGATRFANHWIEHQVRTNVRSALASQGFDWAGVDVSGQQVRLSGSAASAAAGDQALTVARDAKCPTWLGPKTCAISVVGDFGAPAAEARWPDSSATIESGVITLSGEVPNETTREAMVTAADAAVSAGAASQVRDELTVAAGPAPPGADQLALRVASMGARCASGRVAVEAGVFSARCRVAQADEAQLRALVDVALPSGATLGSVQLVVNEEALACEEGLASLLSGTRIEFATSSALIAASTNPLLDRIAEVAESCPGVLRIEGHTDNTGAADLNQTLSEARASSVLTALSQRGLEPSRMVAQGFGQTQPVATNDTSQGRARNRRIEFRVTMSDN